MDKPAKPTPDFPLYAHRNGQWAKRIKGKMYYFGLWEDPQAALEAYLSMVGTSARKPPKIKPRSESKSVPNPSQSVNGKPEKPYPDFPLYAHACGQWAKKIRGKTHFFGPWHDSHAALQRYLREKDDLKAGREPVREGEEGLTVEQLVFRFLAAKKIKVQAKEMTAMTWKQYERYGNYMIQVFGANTLVERLGPLDFQRYREFLQGTHKSLESIKTAVVKTKTMFNWAGPGQNGQKLIDQLPNYGGELANPSDSAMKRERDEKPAKIFTAEQIRLLLSRATLRLRAMILLGINCGFANKDCEKLVEDSVDLVNGWHTFPRPKNGNPRRCPLWPETIEALEKVLTMRTPPADPKFSNRVFITQYAQPYKPGSLVMEFAKLAGRVGMTRSEANFTHLRKTCNSVGIQISDEDAVRTIMGHLRSAKDMTGRYNRMKVSDKRLLAVTDHIHSWLFKDADVQQSESSADVLAVGAD